MKLGIVIPVMNLWFRYTKPCIDSIKTKHEYRLVIVDNASIDDTAREGRWMMNTKSNVLYKRYTSNVGCSPAWNFGINDCFNHGCDYVLVLNNDMILNKDAIDNLVERISKGGDIAMVTCMNVRGECKNPRDVLSLKSEDKKSVPESEHPDFSGYMINKKCWETVGEIDEAFAPAYFEDNDYHYRIRLAGLKAVTCPQALYYHYGSRTQNENIQHPVVRSTMFEKNRDYYVKKWGGTPGAEKFTRPFNDTTKSVKSVQKVINR